MENENKSKKAKLTKAAALSPEEKRRRTVSRAAQKALLRLEELIDNEDTPKSVLMSAINEAMKLASKQGEEHNDNAFELTIKVLGDDD